ncbi:MAG: tRNA threonylcarbamoyladenosine dehydratase [Desulfobacteraceae bacterium]|nr:tRNA threonylcarbamoyladenosine dehydratase [Desulfobacteraceae bacterium]
MNQFTRTEQLLGSEALYKIKQARVAVFGLGAVGSFAVEALARTGIGFFNLIDFDEIDPSNINRQIYALHSTIGEKKALVAKKRIKDINPDCTVEIHDSFVNAESIEDLLTQDVDIVIDAIDGLNSKVNLICKAKEKGLKIVSSMGAAGKTDVSMIKTSDLFETSICPLARFVRRRLRRRGVSIGIPCVYSEEPPKGGTKNQLSEAGSNMEPDHGRIRSSLGTVPYVTGTFGLMIASLVIDTIINF